MSGVVVGLGVWRMRCHATRLLSCLPAVASPPAVCSQSHCLKLAILPACCLVTSTLLGSGLAGMFSMDPGNDPNNPSDPALQQQYNEAAVQVLVLGVQVLRELLKVGGGLGKWGPWLRQSCVTVQR